jgi:hypothetical protein
MKPSYKFKNFCLVFLMGMLIFSLSGCLKNVHRNQSQLEGYPIASDVSTTLQRTVVPGPKPSVKIRLDEVSKYRQYGYGNWTFGDPLKSVTRTDIMPTTYSSTSVTKKAKLFNFFTGEGRSILIAGCGTSQAAKHALRWPTAQVTASTSAPRVCAVL